ncbi:MAG: PepSY domain-containing protein [Gemmatimonas sp.]|uniref:PepSY domain-containing protein n=1 Tax=Gemmatimonas sp. TaxID=1962908 RepID=UPI00391F5E5B
MLAPPAWRVRLDAPSSSCPVCPHAPLPTPAFWRQWHRWIGAPAALFLAFAALTGVLVAATEFFGEDESLREANRTLVSAVTTSAPADAWTGRMATVMANAAQAAPGAPIDKITIELKGQAPVITLALGRPAGGEDKRLIFDARTGALLRTDGYADKPFINRVHSGEAFGDGGLVFAMIWGLALLALTVSGFALYWRLAGANRAQRTGLKRWFF